MAKWEEDVRRVVPYTPGEQPKRTDIIKLNTNENPYPPAPGVQKVLAEYDATDLRKYPDPAITELVEAIAKDHGLSKDQVFVGVGSDDVLAMSFLTFFGSDRPILFPDITYSFYDVWADLFRIPYETIPLDDDFRIDVDAFCGRKNGGIVLPNPNAPTGIFEPTEEIERILKSNPDSIVIIDEAYVDFGGTSVVPLIAHYDNLLVVQTFSKSRALAGSRIGFAMGGTKLISYLNDCKYSFNSYTLDRISILLGKAAISDEAYFQKRIEQIIATREKSKKALEELGFFVLPSRANFLFARHTSCDAAVIFEKLKERGIFVRYFDKPRIRDFLRITIGTDEEMSALIDALKEIV